MEFLTTKCNRVEVVWDMMRWGVTVYYLFFMMYLMTNMKMRFTSSCDFVIKIFKKKRGVRRTNGGARMKRTGGVVMKETGGESRGERGLRNECNISWLLQAVTPRAHYPVSHCDDTITSARKRAWREQISLLCKESEWHIAAGEAGQSAMSHIVQWNIYITPEVRHNHWSALH